MTRLDRRVLAAIRAASTLRIRSRPTSVSSERVTKRASGSYSATTASRSPALRYSSNRPDQSSGWLGSRMDFIVLGSGIDDVPPSGQQLCDRDIELIEGPTGVFDML